MIERRNEGRILEAWKKYRGDDKEPSAVFRYKVDTSELPIEMVLGNLEKLERSLEERGFGLYSIDYTRDFGGTMNYSGLEKYFSEELNFCYASPDTYLCKLQEGEQYIVDVTHSTGRNVFKYMRRTPECVLKTKLYNKIVCNFEAGEVSKQFGSHICEYVACPNKHLEKTFSHPIVLKNGVTRLEVSILGFDPKKDYSNVLENEFRLLEDKPIFHIQPGTRQWENLAEKIDRSLVVADRTTGNIYHAWFGNSMTKKTAGVCISTTDKVRQTDKEWENAIHWSISSFGWNELPIFSFEISMGLEEDGKKSVSISPLECWMKQGPTILTPSSSPTQVFKNKSLPMERLPDTKNIRWILRMKKESQRIGTKPIPWPIYGIPTSRSISTLSRNRREKKIEKILEEKQTEEWKRKIEQLALAKEKETYRKIGISKKEVASILRTKEKIQSEKGRRENIVADFSKKACMEEFWTKIRNKEKVFVYGLRYYPGKTARVAYHDEQGRKGICFDNIGVWEFLNSSKCKTKLHRLPDSEVPKNKHAPIYYVGIGEEIEYSILKRFKENQKTVLSRQLPKCLLSVPYTEHYSIVDIQEGEYSVYKYSEKIYRGKTKTILFFETDDIEYMNGIPVWGYFLQEELDEIEDLSTIQTPMIVHVSKHKTTPQKHKDRRIRLHYRQTDIPISNEIPEDKIETEREKDRKMIPISTLMNALDTKAEAVQLPRGKEQKLTSKMKSKHFLLRQINKWKETLDDISELESEEERNIEQEELKKVFIRKEKLIVQTYQKLYGRKEKSM